MRKNSESGTFSELESNKIFKSTNQSLILNWLSPINSTQVAHALLIVKKNGMASDIESDFHIFLWMPSMGHGSSSILVKKLGTGLYELSDIYFIMDGDWQVRIQLKKDNTILEEQTFDYQL